MFPVHGGIYSLRENSEAITQSPLMSYIYKNICTCIQKYMYLNLGQSDPDRERLRKGLKRKNFMRTFSFISSPCITRMTVFF